MYLQRYMLAVDLSSFRRLAYIIFPSDPTLYCSFILSSFFVLELFFTSQNLTKARECVCVVRRI